MSISLPMKPDKQVLAILMISGHKPRDIETMDVMHINRLYSIIYKWADKGWVEWGMSARYAWVTQEGIVALMERLKVSDPK